MLVTLPSASLEPVGRALRFDGDLGMFLGMIWVD